MDNRKLVDMSAEEFIEAVVANLDELSEEMRRSFTEALLKNIALT